MLPLNFYYSQKKYKVFEPKSVTEVSEDQFCVILIVLVPPMGVKGL